MSNCLWCGEKTDRPKFCCNRHKNRWHNKHNPRGIYAHITERGIEDDMHPLDSYSLGQE